MAASRSRVRAAQALLRERIAPVVGRRDRRRWPTPAAAASPSRWSARATCRPSTTPPSTASPSPTPTACARPARACRWSPGRAAAGHPFAGVLPAGAGAARPDRRHDARRAPTPWRCRKRSRCRWRPRRDPGRPQARRQPAPRRRGRACRPVGARAPAPRCARRRSASPPSWAWPRSPVFAPLAVALLSTGDELVEPGATSPAGAVFDANRPILAGLLRSLPVEVTDLGIAARRRRSRSARILARGRRRPRRDPHLGRRLARRRGPCRPHASQRDWAGSISGRSR